MKRSYRLLGLFWDGLPEHDAPLARVHFNEVPPDAGTEQNLFELDYLARSVECSKLMSCESPFEVAEICSQLIDCDKVSVLLDPAPLFSEGALSRLYLHRSKQVCWAIKSLCGGITVEMVVCEEEAA